MNIQNRAAFKLIPAAILSLCLWGNAPAHANGGVGSGGGGTLPAEKVDEQHIIDSILKSRNLIDAFLKGAEADFVLAQFNGRPGLMPKSYAKFFEGSETVFDLLPKIHVRLLASEPCLGDDGNLYDGSVSAGDPHSICLSPFRIRDKVSYANYQAEVSALMLHEIAHLMGATEDEAVEIQKIAVRFFAGKGSSDIFHWTYQMMGDVENLSQTVGLVAESFQSGGKISCKRLRSALQEGGYRLNRLGDGGSGMFLTREKDTEYYWLLDFRLGAIADFLCTQDGVGNDFDRPYYSKIIETAFANSDRVLAQDYFWAGRPAPAQTRYPLVKLWVSKYSSIEQAVTDLKSAIQDLDGLKKLLQDQWQLEFTRY